MLSFSAFAQSDSTNLPGISVNTPPMTNFGGTSIPYVTQVDQATTFTEAEVLPCPTTGGNGYGYYANGPVPTDGTSTVSEVQGGVIAERTVTTDRFGTTVYGDWTQVNFLCTAIPSPPSCQSGYTQTASPYWDSSSNQWLGLQCQLAAVQVQATPLTYCRTNYQCDYPYATGGVTNGTVAANWALTQNQQYLYQAGWIPNPNGLVIYYSYSSRNNYVFWCPSGYPNLVNIDLVHYFQTGSTIANQKTNTTMCHQ